MENFWAGVGASGAIVAAVLAWMQLRTGRTGLVAEVEAYTYSFPPFFRAGLERLYRHARGRAEEKDANGGAIPIQCHQWLRAELDTIFPPSMRFESEYPRGYMRARIRNKGHATAESVALKISNSGLARLAREGAKSIETQVEGIFEVGDLRPGEEVVVEIWTDFFSSIGARDIQLVQKSGRGKIIKLATVKPFWKWLSEFWGLVLFSVLMAFLSLMWILASST